MSCWYRGLTVSVQRRPPARRDRLARWLLWTKLACGLEAHSGAGADSVLHHVLQRDAPTAMSRLQELHEAWVDADDPSARDPSDFDPFTAVAYSTTGTWTDSIATVLLLMALVEQARAVSPAKEGEVLDMLPIDEILRFSPASAGIF